MGCQMQLLHCRIYYMNTVNQMSYTFYKNVYTLEDSDFEKAKDFF